MRGDTIWLWQVLENGEWGSIYAAVVPGIPGVLVARDLVTAQMLGVYAVAHHDSTGLPVRCVRFDNPITIREVP